MRTLTLDDYIVIALFLGGSILVFRLLASGGDPETMTGPWYHRSRYYEWAAMKRPWGVTKHCLGYIGGCAIVLGIGAVISGGSAVDRAVAVPLAAIILVMPFALIWDVAAGRIRARRARRAALGRDSRASPGVPLRAAPSPVRRSPAP